MSVPFTDFDGFETAVQNSAELKKSIQAKLEAFQWVEPGDSDDVVVDYIISQLANLKGDRSKLATEIEEIVVHTDNPTESTRKITELIDEIYSIVQRLAPSSKPSNPRSPQKSGGAQNGQNGDKPHLNQVQSGRIEKGRNGQGDKSKVFNAMLDGTKTGRFAQAAHNVASLHGADAHLQHQSTGSNGNASLPALQQPRALPTASSPTTTVQPGVCPENWLCKNTQCPLAHQSPVAPFGIAIDVTVECPADVACKNYKCTSRHGSPAKKLEYQASQICRYNQYCANPNCTFKHDEPGAAGAGAGAGAGAAGPAAAKPQPKAPYCHNGADCAVPNCRFTHSTVMCRFNPCKNPVCTFKHAEGQKATMGMGPGGAGSNVWRKPVPDTATEEPEELILPGRTAAGDLPLRLAGSTAASVQGQGQGEKEAAVAATTTTTASAPVPAPVPVPAESETAKTDGESSAPEGPKASDPAPTTAPSDPAPAPAPAASSSTTETSAAVPPS